jgi:hypothetical protein
MVESATRIVKATVEFRDMEETYGEHIVYLSTGSDDDAILAARDELAALSHYDDDRLPIGTWKSRWKRSTRCRRAWP